MRQPSENKLSCILASDFDQTLSFNDSGDVLSEMLETADFRQKVEGLAAINLVQQGGELAYLLQHDPDYRRVRKHHLVEVGKRIRLKSNIKFLTELLRDAIPGYEFELFVISAAPEEVITSALEGLISPDHIYGTQLQYDDNTGEIQCIRRLSAGYGKVAVLEQLHSKLQVPYDRIAYVGDGSSDIHVMLHLNHRNGVTIAVSEAKQISEVASRTVPSEDTLSILVPVLEDVAHLTEVDIRRLLQQWGLDIQDWNRGRTDWVSIHPSTNAAGKERAA